MKKLAILLCITLASCQTRDDRIYHELNKADKYLAKAQYFTNSAKRIFNDTILNKDSVQLCKATDYLNKSDYFIKIGDSINHLADSLNIFR